MRILALGIWLVAHAASGEVTDPTAMQQAKLKAAVRAVLDLNDDYARTLLNDLLAMAPVDHIAAQAYLYLGVMDFNALDYGHAREELRHALELDPTVEIPPLTSPKIALAFAEIRRQLLLKMTTPAQARPAPAEAVAAPPVVVEQEAPRRSGAWPWIFGVTAVAAIGVSVWGWVQVSSFESLKSSSSPTNLVSPAQAQSSQSSASVGETVGIITLIAAAGLTTGLVLTW
jgi:hypothetical protein